MKLKEWIKEKKDPDELIVQASVRSGMDSWTPYPIGMGHKFVNHHEDALKHRRKTELILVAFNTETDKRRRGKHKLNRKFFAKKLAHNRFPNVSLDAEEYFKTIGKYKFVASPEGNGIDCHRHYEALFAGCIPILEKNPKSEHKYSGCPILWTTDYSEITEDYLNMKWKEMLNSEYDFSSLLLSSYDSEMQDIIKKRGNYWCLKLEGKEWYK
jgi:hypothetical protein